MSAAFPLPCSCMYDPEAETFQRGKHLTGDRIHDCEIDGVKVRIVISAEVPRHPVYTTRVLRHPDQPIDGMDE